MSQPSVSFVLATHNRRRALMQTLRHLRVCGLPLSAMQTIVVDNASTDTTRRVVGKGVDRYVRLRKNLGSCAKSVGVRHADAEIIVFLDDDSYPVPGSVTRMLQHFRDDPILGAAGCTVILPDGRREGAALPRVFVGCGVGIRASALHDCGGLDASFFMQAEEYDLCCRMANSGWRLAVFDDVFVRHMKTPTARLLGRTMFYDVRNNLRVVARYAPDEVLETMKQETKLRYKWLAEGSGLSRHYQRGLAAGMMLGPKERRRFRQLRLDGESFEYLYHWGEIHGRMSSLHQGGARRVLLAGFGKNIYPFYESARQLGLGVAAIADTRFYGAGRTYRGIPVVSDSKAAALQPDAIVVSDSSPVHSHVAYEAWRKRAVAPVYAWFAAPPAGNAIAARAHGHEGAELAHMV